MLSLHYPSRLTGGSPSMAPLFRACGSRRVVNTAAAALLLAQLVLLACSASWHSPTCDELGHLPAGLAYWWDGRLDLYRVNPPLVRAVAAIPVTLMNPVVRWPIQAILPGARPEFGIGADMILANGQRSAWLFIAARWACLPFALVGGIACYRWSTEIHGRAGGFASLMLWCTCPYVLGHASLITPDAPAAALGVSAGFFFWRWLRRPTWGGASCNGILLGLANITKLSWVLLFVIWPILWALSTRLGRRRAGPSQDVAGSASQLAVSLLLGLYVINLGYGFGGSFTRLGDLPFVSRAFGGTSAPGNRFRGTALGLVPVPLPAEYVRGFDVQTRDFEELKPSYLKGEWKDGGWWYYYLYALAVKTPLGTSLLVGLGAIACVTGPGRSDALPIWIPPLVFLTVASAQTGFSHHVRYVLPCLPFFYVGAGRLFVPGSAWRRAIACGALSASVLSSLCVYPHSLSYFHELAGGPIEGHRHLLDSNVDWGQDLFFLKDWMDSNPSSRPLSLSYYGYLDPRALGLEVKLDPTGLPLDAMADGRPPWTDPKPGWYAVSVGRLSDRSGAYSFFLDRPIAGRAGYSIFIYHLDDRSVAAIRRKLGLPERARGSEG